MPIRKLNQQLIDSDQLQCPEGKRRIEYVHDDRSGLYLEVRNTAPDRGTWYLRVKINGKTRHFKLGSTKEISLAEAKANVKTLKAEIELGGDPRTDNRTPAKAITWNDFMEDHYLPFARLHKRSHGKDEGLHRNRLSGLIGKKPLGDITRRELQEFHNQLREEGLSASTANHHIRLIKRVFNMAIGLEMHTGSNPAVGIPLFQEPKVERYLDDEELENLLTVLRTDSNRMVCSILLFTLATGARLNEVLQAKRENVDEENRVWRIPAINSKSKVVRSVPLNDAALNVLKGLDDSTEYCFVNKKTGKPYVTIHKAWERLRKEAGLPRLRIHDLRHQYASFLVNSGRTLYEVQQILGHSSPDVTQRYAHLSTKSLQEAANSASDIITGAMTGSE